MPTDGLAVAAFVLGILSVVLCWLPFVNASLSVLAVVFGIVGTVRGVSRGMAIAGLVLGCVGLLVVVIVFAATIVGLVGLAQLPDLPHVDADL